MATSVCRVCLVGNTRMLNIDNVHLLEMYEKLTDTKLHTGENGMPSTVCYVCHQQLQKCQRFSHVAHKSNWILQDLLLNGTEVTQNMVAMQSKKMHNLSVTVTKNISIDIDSGTESTAETFPEVQVVVEEEETNAYKNDTVEVLLEMPDELAMGNIFNDMEPKINIRRKSHSCTRCNKAFFKRNHLAKHMLVHTGEKPHICNRCDKAFNQKCSLMRHMLVHTGEKPYSCKSCNKSFTQKGHLATHMLAHTASKPYPCSTCDKAFNCKSSLAKHMQVHTGVTTYPCNACDKVFTQKVNLTSHMLVHTQTSHSNVTDNKASTLSNLASRSVKPYPCRRCDKAFNCKSSLSKHSMLVHTGERIYSCKVCDKAFTQKSSLTTHMLVHPGESEKEEKKIHLINKQKIKKEP